MLRLTEDCESTWSIDPLRSVFEIKPANMFCPFQISLPEGQDIYVPGLVDPHPQCWENHGKSSQIPAPFGTTKIWMRDCSAWMENGWKWWIGFPRIIEQLFWMESCGYGRWSCYDIYFLTESPKWLIITLWLRDDNWRAFKNIEPKIMGQMPSDAFKHTIFIFLHTHTHIYIYYTYIPYGLTEPYGKQCPQWDEDDEDDDDNDDDGTWHEIINSQTFPLQVLTMVHDTQIEVQARRTVATWAQQAWWGAHESPLNHHWIHGPAGTGTPGEEPDDCQQLSEFAADSMSMVNLSIPSPSPHPNQIRCIALARLLDT